MGKLKQHYKTFRTLLAVLAISIFASGCTIKLAYNFLDWGLYWQMEDYVKFNRDQSSLVKDELSKLVDWHRSDELPKYADQLEKLSNGLENGLTVEQLDDTYNSLSIGWQRIVIKTLPAATDIMSKLTDQQVNDFFEILIEEEQDDARDIERDTEEKLSEERAEYLSKKISDLIGKLNDEQKTLIVQWAPRIQPTAQLSLDHTIQWRIKMQSTMVERQNKQQLEETLLVLFANPDQLWSDEYRRAIEKNQHLVMQLIFDINQTLTDKQRRKLVRKLNSFIEDLRDLSD
jgi:hypothetical protein|tara:strand:+ start:16086 stop:16949 length:864 start_codon:yes stop_codon:yes gene_type:complete